MKWEISRWGIDKINKKAFISYNVLVNPEAKYSYEEEWYKVKFDIKESKMDGAFDIKVSIIEAGIVEIGSSFMTLTYKKKLPPIEKFKNLFEWNMITKRKFEEFGFKELYDIFIKHFYREILPRMYK